MPEERIYLPSAGAIPGFPGSHGAGDYLVDVEARTIRPYEEPAPVQEAPATQPKQSAKKAPVAPEPAPDVAKELAHVEDELHTLEAEQSAPQA